MKKTLKRGLILLPLLCMMTMAVFAVSGCDEGEGEKEHTTHTPRADWTVETPATCTEGGTEVLLCEKCDEILDRRTTNALDHKWDSGKITVPVTCEEPGLKVYTCLNDSTHTRDEVLPKTGHKYSSEYTVDKFPTEAEVGSKSRHCVNSGCESKIDERVMDLNEVIYRVYVNRLSGASLQTNITVTMYDTDGNQVYQGSLVTVTGKLPASFATTILPIGEYKVKLSGIPEGFEYETEYTISADNGVYPYETEEKYPTLDIRLESHLLSGNLTRISKGKVLPDFSMTTIDNETLTLSGLLSRYKLVVMTYYFNGCIYCRTESKELEKIYDKYRNDMVIICLNVSDDVNDIRAGKYLFNYPTDYYVSDLSGRFFYITDENPYGGTPLTVFIDSGGFVGDIIAGAVDSSRLELAISQNIFTTPAKEAQAQATGEVSYNPAILPEKKELFV